MNFRILTIIVLSSFVSFQNIFANTFLAKDSTEKKHEAPILLNKKGIPILPEAGDWAIAFDAVPLLEFSASVLSNNMVTPQAGFTGGYPLSISGKYFKSNDLAYRGRLMLNMGRDNVNKIVQNDREINDNPDATLSDTRQIGNTQGVLAFGIEKRKGKTRIQGIYGAEALLMFNRTKTDYNYGNSFTESNTNPSTSNFDDGNIVAPGQRILSNAGGGEFGIGARAFIGVEFFVMPKLSLGMEYGLAMMFTNVSPKTNIVESWDTPNQAIERKTTTVEGRANNFGLNGDVSGGAIHLTFYF